MDELLQMLEAYKREYKAKRMLSDNTKILERDGIAWDKMTVEGARRWYEGRMRSEVDLGRAEGRIEVMEAVIKNIIDEKPHRMRVPKMRLM